MKRIRYLTLSALFLSLPLPVLAARQWQTITFGQSTDVNFSSNVLPEKVGVNDVTIDGKRLSFGEKVDLSRPITLESRGGKIANAHDGLTFFYTQLPTDKNMRLEATITVDQFGPENSARPAAQEGAGLLVRDILGSPRQQPLKEGYEEFPAASNMVMNAIMTQDKKDKTRVKMQAIVREGISQPWGNTGSAIARNTYKEEIDLSKTPTFRLKLERTNEGFITAWAPQGSDKWVSSAVKHADLIAVQNKSHYYVGFFAARNAKITVSDVTFTTSPASTTPSPTWQPKPWPVVMQRNSSDISTQVNYPVQAKANYAGTFTLRQNDVTIGDSKTVNAGDMYRTPATLGGENRFTLTFTPDDRQNKPVSEDFTVKLLTNSNRRVLYVSPDGQPDNDGTSTAPLDLSSAVKQVPPGGTIILSAGDYPSTVLPARVSGTPEQPKNLEAHGKAVIHGLLVDASYWHIKGIDITKKSLRIQGSHNLVEQVTAYNNDDTGIQISSPPDVGRPLWASHNRIINSQSFANEDPGKINADGFAVKMRVGEGNVLDGCYAYDNIDDGFDLFNKIEDGANGVVEIKNSIARHNTSNGFKLGGEGQPAAHRISNSIAINNGLDGFTDNFNPGAMKVDHNVAVDNQRFNYIFRPSPYGDPQTQGLFSHNLSLRSKPGKYDDAVVGNIDASNFFIVNGKSVNSEGKSISSEAYKTLTLPQPLERNTDGSFKKGDFLQQR